ncbi:major facilitator superfamily MFS_1 [Shewanella halifaxensis HAW-EB4]|uniref:Major facilitator superfamily MFS_1 n=2 Tax=Shewanella halifaxensis TaxID=271098 RepID=B0TTJ5_SHEHH|nr:major facilitator superfamily MFS_1 [Shewanella halifaxensis HAW-EB4]
MKPDPMKQRLLNWAPVWLLALTAFVFVSTEFVPVGILAALGQSFNMSAVAVGPMLTVYAAVVALASLPAVLLFARFERKKLLLGIMAVFIISHGICVWAPSYDILLSGRIGIALTHALFWAIAPALVVRLAPEGQGAKALSIFATGCVLALVLGIPLGRVIGQLIGWRSIFALIGLLTFAMMLLLWRGLPNLPATHGGSWRSLPALARNKALLWLYLLTMTLVTAHYSVYTYLEPLLQEHFGYSANITTMILLTFGGAGLIGSALFSRYQARNAQQLLMIAIASLGTCMAILPFIASQIWLLLPLCILWGTGMMLMCLSLQSKALKLAPDATDVAMAIYSGLFNVGIGSGALLGSIVAAQYGVVQNGTWATLLVLLALVPLFFLLQARRATLAVH